MIPADTSQAHARTTDPETSHEAAASISRENLSQLHARLLWLFNHPGYTHGSTLGTGTLDEDGIREAFTDREIETAYRNAYEPPADSPLWEGISLQSIRSRRAELVRVGLVEFSGQYNYQRPRRERMWQATKGPTS